MYKVLLVEDEEIIRKGLMFAVDWLKEDCIVVGEAANGKEGLEKIAALAPDIVITDVRMPFVDGLEMLARSANTAYEAIIISGYNEFDYAKKAISLGVVEYLLKPVDFNILHHTLTKIKQRIDQKRNVTAALQHTPPPRPREPLLPSLPPAKNKYTARLLQRIQTDYAQKLSLHAISREYGVSSVYLHTKFKEDTNYTFHDFLNRYRIMRAIELLQAGGKKVYEIADLTGFHDYKHFTLVFKKYLGCTPGHFQNES